MCLSCRGRNGPASRGSPGPQAHGSGKLTCRIRCRTCCGHTAAPRATTQQWGSTSDLHHCPRHPMQPRAPAQPRFAAGMRRCWPHSQCPAAQACSWLQGRPPRRRAASEPSFCRRAGNYTGPIPYTYFQPVLLPRRASGACCAASARPRDTRGSGDRGRRRLLPCLCNALLFSDRQHFDEQTRMWVGESSEADPTLRVQSKTPILCAPAPETSLAARAPPRRPDDPATRCVRSATLEEREGEGARPHWCTPQSAWPPLRG
ncbi:hypothetical protein B0J12DRAFT_291569 [Macrophomina phaseolina]|uniref:Uncharacterized protein n=1 Tax=Macrophomina phaseolina TaxID=35725 RepID=A0ABQ8GRQ2_9PEZI|nr:hypothetical protein B0J12DRAFT_291569 [Macrophomina phaseolina]